jgi:hypothetical protein
MTAARFRRATVLFGRFHSAAQRLTLLRFPDQRQRKLLAAVVGKKKQKYRPIRSAASVPTATALSNAIAVHIQKNLKSYCWFVAPEVVTFSQRIFL